MDSTSTLILGISLMVIMWGMGLSLEVKDFKNVANYPKATLLGIVNQLIFLPIIAYCIVIILRLPSEIAVGLMILSACPGGATSNLITYLAKGDTALSISLTALSSIITVFSIPFVINFSLALFAAEGSVQLDVIDTLKKTFFVLILPVSVGMLIRRISIPFAKKMEKPMKIASASLLFIIIVALMIKEREQLASYFQQAGLATLLLNLSTMTLGYFSAKLLRLKKAQAISISIESGIQNGTFALAIAGGLLQNTAYGIAPGIYSLIMYLTGGVFVFTMLRKKEPIPA